MQVGCDPLPVVNERAPCRLLSLPRSQAFVDAVELFSDGREALPLGLGAGPLAGLQAVLLVLGQPRDLRSHKLRLLAQARRRDDRGAGRGCLEGHPLDSFEGRDEDGRLVQQASASAAVAERADPGATPEGARDRRPAAQRLRPQQDELPAG